MDASSNVRPDRSLTTIRLRKIGNSLRTFLYVRLRCPWLQISGFVRIPWTVRIWSPHKDVRLGRNVQFGRHCIVQADAQFGNNVLIADHVAFVGRDEHRYDVVGSSIWESPRGDKHRILVGDDVWIGHGAIILSGVTIGTGSIVGAGAVVTRDIPNYGIVVGNPAHLVKMRFTLEQVDDHERILRSRNYT